jgi:hypothetical protein
MTLTAWGLRMPLCRTLVRNARTQREDRPREQVEVIRHVAHLDCVSCIVAASTATHEVGGEGEHIDELALALIAPLGPEHHCRHPPVSA